MQLRRRARESKNNHFIGSAMGHDIVVGAHGAGAVSGGCFNPAVVRGLEVACIHLGLGYCPGCWLGFSSSLLVGMKAVTKESKNNHFVGSAMGHLIVVGAHAAGAVSGGCFNPVVVRGLEVACIDLELGYCLGCRLGCCRSA